MQQHETHPVPETPRKQGQSPQRCLRDGGRHVCDGTTCAIMESVPRPWAPLLHDSPTSTMAPLESFARSCGTRQPRQDWVSLPPATSPLSAVTPPLPAAAASPAPAASASPIRACAAHIRVVHAWVRVHVCACACVYVRRAREFCACRVVHYDCMCCLAVLFYSRTTGTVEQRHCVTPATRRCVYVVSWSVVAVLTGVSSVAAMFVLAAVAIVLQ